MSEETLSNLTKTKTDGIVPHVLRELSPEEWENYWDYPTQTNYSSKSNKTNKK